MNLMSEAGPASSTSSRRRAKVVNHDKGSRHEELDVEGLLERETLTDSLDTVLDSSVYGSLLSEYETDLETLKRELDWKKEENIPIFELMIKEDKELIRTGSTASHRSRGKGKKAEKRSESE